MEVLGAPRWPAKTGASVASNEPTGGGEGWPDPFYSSTTRFAACVVPHAPGGWEGRNGQRKIVPTWAGWVPTFEGKTMASQRLAMSATS